jgi:hypothetical protein
MGDLSYVAGEFRIFGAIFLEDGCSLLECHISLFELGKVLYSEVFNFVGGRLLLNREVFNVSFKRRRSLSLSGAGFF